MSATVGTADMDVINGLKILSLDAGGSQAVSQLRILEHLMEKISQDNQGTSQGMVKRPCEIFDVIGGVGTGGLIAMFLVVFKMTATEALEEFTKFVVDVYKDADQDPEKQTKRLKEALEGILVKHKFAKETKLIPVDEQTATCKLIVPVMYKNNIGVTCVLRNHVIHQEPPTNLTLAEAMLATSAISPMFTPINIGKDFSTFEYVSGDLGFSNPIREVIAGARPASGAEATVACLLSIGCGHSSVKSLPGTSDSATQIDFLERLAMDSEKVAQDISTQMAQFPIYHRLSLNYGPEVPQSRAWTDPATTTARTEVYLKGLEATELMNRCVDSIKTGHGSVTLEQLRHASGAAIPPRRPQRRPTKLQEYEDKVVEEPLGTDHPDPILASANLAITYSQEGRHAEAADLKLDVLNRRKQQLGDDHLDTIDAAASLAFTYGQLERYEEAEKLELEVLAQRKRQLAPNDPRTITASLNLATTHSLLGHFAKAEVLELEVLEQRKQQLGIDDPKTINASFNLAITYCSLRRYDEAKGLATEVVRLRQLNLGPQDPDTLEAMELLASIERNSRPRRRDRILAHLPWFFCIMVVIWAILNHKYTFT